MPVTIDSSRWLSCFWAYAEAVCPSRDSRQRELLMPWVMGNKYSRRGEATIPGPHSLHPTFFQWVPSEGDTTFSIVLQTRATGDSSDSSYGRNWRWAVLYILCSTESVSEIQLPRAEISWLKIKLDVKVICECSAAHRGKQLLFLAISIGLVFGDDLHHRQVKQTYAYRFGPIQINWKTTT